MNILITGATGFIGSRLALKCLGRGDSVRVLGQVNNRAEDHNRRLLERSGAKVIIGSVTERDRVSEAIQGIDHVHHLAAAQHEANVPDQRFWDVNVSGTKAVLEASIDAGVKRFIHGSTIGVYGASLEGSIDEGSPLQPNNIYGVTKLEAEKLLLECKEKLPVVIIRISETYGPGDMRLLKLFKAIKKGVFFVIGRGDNLHHLIYIDDLIDGLLLAASVEPAKGQIFVLAGKEILSTREMVTAIADYFGSAIPRLHAPLLPFLAVASLLESVLRPLGVQPPLHKRRMDFFRKGFMFSSVHSESVLGFRPQTSFRAGVGWTAEWYEAQGYL